MRLVHGWMTENNEQLFGAEVYYVEVRTPAGERDTRAVEFGITAHADDAHSWSGRQREFALELAAHKFSAEWYPYPRMPISREVAIFNALASPLEAIADESVEEYRRQHTKHARLPLPPPPFGSGRTAMIPHAHYGLHDLEQVREHTRKTPDVVVSVAVRLLSRDDLTRAERATAACTLVLRLLAAYLRTHKGKWPSSWDQLEQLEPVKSGNFSWPKDAEQVRQYVQVDFSADPGELWKRPIEELDVIQPIGLHKPYTSSDEFEELHETLRATQSTHTL